MRRLRENAMLETEIGKSGEVTVEGHVIGRLDGFMFAPDASAEGSEAKALNAAAQKALGGEIEARATKISQASNDQIVLATDGALRWTGDLVGKLTAGDDTLRPRVRVLADEHLTGPARELVQTRLDLWLKTHIEKLLAPLFSLTAADDITGVARGVAFQLVESLGVLERQKVAEEVKGLDQPARATLRKYGVRFGAYHIYLPALLKPAPRSLATQLWAIKHESPEAKGVGDLLHLAASGRTSIPVDKDTPKALYRTAGYRICGERAVRVDILERLADLIRPALSWRESAPGPKPDGVFDGRGFLVTGAMTSLTGASGDDFASILRSLGYRMDRRPKPAEPAAAAPVAEPAVSNDVPATVEATTEAIGEATAEAGSSSEKPEPVAELQSRSLLPEPELVTSEIAPETVPGADASALVAEPATELAAPTDTPPVAVAENKPAEEPAFVEVWRPAGRSERRPHRPRRPRPQQTQTASSDAAAVPATTSAEGTAPATSDSAQPSQGPRPRHDRSERPDREKRHERHERQQRMERQGERAERQGHAARRDRPRRERGERVDRAEREQYYAKPFGSGSGGRDKQPDPNSPFAKLAALKQQLEQTNKEPS
jgi:ATP-dependent RNA helicase SUPV3L1/SUV3